MMNEKIKISVLIPAYNVEPYIDQCLESVMNQTLRDIEIIITDDGSTDRTRAYIEAAAEKDERVRIIRHKENLGIYQSRKDAVLVSRGEYVIFVDADDWLELDACELVRAEAEKDGADIIHYGAAMENCGNLPQKRVDDVQRYLDHYLTTTVRKPLVAACYADDALSVTMWQKAVKSEKARRAFERMPDAFVSMYEDEYASIALYTECESLRRIPKRLYHYCYGRGSCGHAVLTLEEFGCHCRGAAVCNELDRYLSELESRPEEYQPELLAAARRAAEIVKEKIIRKQISLWLNNIRQEERAAAYLTLEETWGTDRTTFLGLLVKNAWNRREAVAQALAGAEFLRYSGRPVRTVALYVHRLRCGGGARVVSLLGNLFASLKDEEGNFKYRVVIINEEEATELDYPLSPRIIRVWIPSMQNSVREKYLPRADAWARIVREYEVDAIFYSNWTASQLMWDLLAVKRTERNPAFVIHVHNWCATMYQNHTNSVQDRESTFRLADGIVTLSEADRLYWSRIHPNTRYIPNPCFVKASEMKRAAFGKHILWIARLAQEKQPTEIIRIMREVHARDLEIVCHVVGEDYGRLQDALEEDVRAEGLSGSVIFEGFRKDAKTIYENSSLFFMTSRFEGFPLTLYEAAAFGLPTVMYELPWLSYCSDIQGWVGVPQLDAEAAAEAIVRIVNDPAEWQERSDALYESALRYEKTDIAAHWTALIESLEKGTLPDEPRFDRQTEILLDQIDAFHDSAVSRLKQERDRERKKSKRLERELRDIKGSASFRIGRAITWLPRKVRGGIRCCREHSIAYTARQFVKHLTGKA